VGRLSTGRVAAPGEERRRWRGGVDVQYYETLDDCEGEHGLGLELNVFGWLVRQILVDLTALQIHDNLRYLKHIAPLFTSTLYAYPRSSIFRNGRSHPCM